MDLSKPPRAIAVGHYFAGVVTHDGKLFTWGSSFGTFEEAGPTLKPKRVMIKEEVEKLACGRFHMAAITTSRTLYTFGYGSTGALGYESDFEPTPRVAAEELACAGVSCAKGFTVGYTMLDEVFVFGANERLLFIMPETLAHERIVDAGMYIRDSEDSDTVERICVVLFASGLIIRWNVFHACSNENGAAGDWTLVGYLRESNIAKCTLPGAVALSCADRRAFIWTSSGTAYVLGQYDADEVGTVDPPSLDEPVRLPIPGCVLSISSTGACSVAVVRRSDVDLREDLWAWGLASSAFCVPTSGPTRVLKDVTMAACGNLCGLAVRNASIVTWGFPSNIAPRVADCDDAELARLLREATEELAARASARVGVENVAFTCPITKRTMEDPVTASDGHTYERTAIERHLKKSSLSPITRGVLTGTLHDNRLARETIALATKRKRDELLDA
jgi:hypothetical protein